MPSPRPAGIGQTRRHAPAHASHHEPRARPVAAGARRVLAFYGRRLTSPPPLRSSEPTPSARRVPAWGRSSGGRGRDLTRANRGAFGKLSKWRCERAKPSPRRARTTTVREEQGQTRHRESRRAAGRGMAPKPWRGRHRSGHSELPGLDAVMLDLEWRTWRIAREPESPRGIKPN